MNNCQFDPEQINLDEDTPIECPICGHYVAVGRPHPDFSNRDLPVSEEELIRLSQLRN